MTTLGGPEVLPHLAATILSDLSTSPSAELSRLIGATAPRRLLSGPTGPGTAALRIPWPVVPTSEDAEPSGEPRLFCPGPVRDDPVLAQQVNDELVSWAEQVGIYPGRLDQLRACDFGRLITLAHPATDDPDRLLAAAKCVVAEWAADDYIVDEVGLGADPRVVGSRLAMLHAVVDPARLPDGYQQQLQQYRQDDPIARAFRSAMQHLARYTSTAQLGRFQHQMSILFVAWNQEANWHTTGRTPPVWEYLVQRHLNSYLPPMILVDVVAGYEVPSQEFFDPRLRRAFTTAGLANVLLNDLHSGAQESESDFNLPRVLVAESKCSVREAMDRTVEIHNELMHAFVAEATALSLTGSPTIRRFLADTWAWLGGSREWHATTARYRNDPSAGAPTGTTGAPTGTRS